jgi:hypothetical protein
MMDQVLRFLPNLSAAALILGVGWFIARIVQRIVANLLVEVGADALSEWVGLGPVLGPQRLSGILGRIVYILILIPVLIAALNGLALEAITRSASNMLTVILAEAMALRQMGLANAIINLTFGLLLGAVAVAVAIAFGLGGRDIAARKLGAWIEAIRPKKSSG